MDILMRADVGSAAKGWGEIVDWRSCYWREECSAFLLACFGDFEFSGPARRMQRVWNDIVGDPDAPERGGLRMDIPMPQRRFLGCEHVESQVEFPNGATVRRMEYNMEPFFRGCLSRWTEVTGQHWEDLLHACAPFLDEDALRRSHNIGPLGYKLVAVFDKVAKRKRLK